MAFPWLAVCYKITTLNKTNIYTANLYMINGKEIRMYIEQIFISFLNIRAS